MKIISSFTKSIIETIETKKKLIAIEDQVNKSVLKIHKTIKSGGKIFFCGNGGSAADAQHLAAELLIRLRPKINRNPIPAISLSMDTSTLTACGNDYNFEKIFSRPFEALANKKDILVAISTSGNSQNIINVLKIAKKKKIFTICFLGKDGGKAKNLSDIKLLVDSFSVARVQEAHIFLGHYILEKVEDLYLRKN